MTDKIVRHVMMSKKVALRHLTQMVTVRPHLKISFPSQDLVDKLNTAAEEHFGPVIMAQFGIDAGEDHICFSHPEIQRVLELDQLADDLGLETSGAE